MEQKKMTMQEAEKKIDTYKEIFSVVRLLKGEEIEETQKQIMFTQRMVQCVNLAISLTMVNLPRYQ